ncbi:MAG TPA: hypothetical protein VF622_17940 [Segetibacter sp.]|jgi:exopolysaccharide biosynthesis protein
MNDLEVVKQVALKNRIWYIGTVIVVGLILLSVMLFYEPKVKIDDTIIKQKQTEIEANQKQIQAFERLVDVQIERIAEFARRDSLLLNIATTNKENIARIKEKKNETIKVFDSYGPDDWTVYYSKLPETLR